MTRASRDELHPGTGRVWNGFDYRLQVWVRDGIVQPCGHPVGMRTSGPCCAQHAYAGRSILAIEGAETRTDSPAPDAEARDPLSRILDRHGYIRRGELTHLRDDLPVVITLASGHRASTTAGQAARFIELLGDELAEVYLPAAVCHLLRSRGDLNTGTGPGKSE